MSTCRKVCARSRCSFTSMRCRRCVTRSIGNCRRSCVRSGASERRPREGFPADRHTDEQPKRSSIRPFAVRDLRAALSPRQDGGVALAGHEPSAPRGFRSDDADKAISSRAREGIERVRRFLAEDPARNVTTEQLGRMAGMNRTKLRSLFKRVHGMTMFEYRQALIMKSADEMLRQPNLHDCRDRLPARLP